MHTVYHVCMGRQLWTLLDVAVATHAVLISSKSHHCHQCQIPPSQVLVRAVG